MVVVVEVVVVVVVGVVFIQALVYGSYLYGSKVPPYHLSSSSSSYHHHHHYTTTTTSHTCFIISQVGARIGLGPGGISDRKTIPTKATHATRGRRREGEDLILWTIVVRKVGVVVVVLIVLVGIVLLYDSVVEERMRCQG